MFANQNSYQLARLADLKKISGILFIISALLFSSLGKTYSFENTNKELKEMISGVSSTEEAPDETAIVKSFSLEAVIPFIQVDLSHDLYLLLEKPFIILSYKTKNFEKISIPNRYFKTLFYFTISPNAP